ncbi:MAG: CinA family nicotinamide mononucleotide deamidase-related protein [Chitinophagaceae bacterium]|nr:CinA family nicotinamide mononucleotide deamidase-related protein [Chitinophagaceae bacterium]
MQPVLASIITIGDELLIGQTIDTNSAWMAQELNKVGIAVHRRLAIGDVWKDIWESLNEESRLSKIILITGGLGPTADDITKPLLCQYFGGKLVVNEAALVNVTSIFERLNRPLLERNLKQAEVPDVCTVIQNRRGTAPGMMFEKDGVIFVSMPGVPNEMKGMMTADVLPLLAGRFNLNPIVHRTLVTAGIGESFLAERIKEFEDSLPSNIKLAYLPNYGMVKLRLSATGNDNKTIAELEALFDMLKQQVADVMVIDEDISLQEAVGRLLSSHGKSMGTAESCTGGYIAHLLTGVSGASNYFKGSIVSYSNDIKQHLLDVSAQTLTTVGAVSEDTVIQMVKGALHQLKTDYIVATSGIMGPRGGSSEKPVGTVWIAVGNKNRIRTHHFHFRFDRQRNMDMTAQNALNMLRKFIIEMEQ